MYENMSHLDTFTGTTRNLTRTGNFLIHVIKNFKGKRKFTTVKMQDIKDLHFISLWFFNLSSPPGCQLYPQANLPWGSRRKQGLHTYFLHPQSSWSKDCTLPWLYYFWANCSSGSTVFDLTWDCLFPFPEPVAIPWGNVIRCIDLCLWAEGRVNIS